MRLPKLFASATIVSVASLAFAVRAADMESLPDAGASKGQEILQCQSDLLTFEDELVQAGFGVLAPGGYVGGYAGYKTGYGLIGTPRQQMQMLRDAAGVYALAGDERACQMVLASMRDIYEAHDKLVGFETDNPEARTAWRRVHLAKAVPVTEMDRLMRADVIIGVDLRTADDTMLGEIKDIVLDPKRQTIAYVLASRGGFLGLTEELIAVRWADLRATDDHEIYVLDVSPEAFAAAPKVERRNFEASSGQGWRNSLDQYWAGVIDKS
ncbi:PRC-barrel domain-containing protein [Roseovarius sp. M141]|uniref:PRC-barrel domain-containing protein n=1 Tax=Roseovarius sp. M141 TaxID=2583806 RepID=UPI0020CBCE1B|nr:PRC-barrel domain-containing protein [Roseovarius sp. M141]MCQ0090441.1 PRC-barrel domain containing protein [Roseovarius sp. M141]